MQSFAAHDSGGHYLIPAPAVRSLSVLLLCLTLLVAASACGEGQSKPLERAQAEAGPAAQPTTGQFGIAAPAHFAGLLANKPRRTSYVPSDFYRAGETFSQVLPHNKVTANAPGAQFAPNWTKASPDFSGLSYAMYDFRIPGFNLNPSLGYAWNTPPADFKMVFFGLANWGKNRWDWYQADADGRLDLTSLNDYFDFGGDILVCVLQLGTIPSELDWLRISSIPPDVVLSAPVTHGFVPLTVDFDATGSTDADGTIAEYRWDPEGDGSFDQSTGTDPHFEFIYQQKGDMLPAVRVIDNDGVSTDKSLDVLALDNGFTTLGAAAIQEEADSVIIRPDGKLLLFGRSGDQISHKFHITAGIVDPNGSLLSMRYWSGGTDDDLLGDAVMSNDGSVYTSGGTFPQGLVQKWNQDGELLWSKSVDGLPSLSFSQIGCIADRIYCAGFATPTGSGISAALVCLDLDGNVIWSRVITSPQNCQFADLVTYSSIVVGRDSVRLCGNYVPGAGQASCALYAAFGTDGSLQACKLLGGDTATYATGIAITGLFVPTTYVLGMHYNGVSSYDAFINKLGGSTSFIQDASYLYHTAGLQFTGTGALAAVLKCTTSLADQYGALAVVRLDSSFNLLSGNLLNAAPNGQGAPSSISSYNGQGLIVTGEHAGALPTSTPYTPTVTASTLDWTDFTPTVLEPALASFPLSTEMTDLSGYEFDRGTDTDAYMYLEKN